MKKIISIVLAIIFLSSTIGVTLATHYCGGKLFSTRILTHSDYDPCGCPSSPMRADCCKDEIKNFKVQDDFVSSNFLLINSNNINFEFLFSPLNSYSNLVFHQHQLFSINHSPPIISISVPILIQSFRF